MWPFFQLLEFIFKLAPQILQNSLRISEFLFKLAPQILQNFLEIAPKRKENFSRNFKPYFFLKLTRAQQHSTEIIFLVLKIYKNNYLDSLYWSNASL